ncbi:hypothetical protein L3Y34_005973 [Caenorhabditis briggsae]|uniref:SPK domain-containing protein n=1 Tax=Caenorhabditis briggsae TaxID=6238 RepID=A0AAE9CXU7_CAEBR|nr:hypothetical protein L3Y34_005973 [Caenorhabditis briggsae]
MRPAWKLRSYYFNKLAPNLHKAFLSGEAKMKLYFGLGMSMNKAFLDELRTEAVVDVDQFTRMIRFFQIDKYRLYMEFPDLLRPLSIFPEVPRGCKTVFCTEPACKSRADQAISRNCKCYRR